MIFLELMTQIHDSLKLFAEGSVDVINLTLPFQIFSGVKNPVHFSSATLI